MGVSGSSWDNEVLVYILTLGVLKGFRNQGIASKLVNLVQQHAWKIG